MFICLPTLRFHLHYVKLPVALFDSSFSRFVALSFVNIFSLSMKCVHFFKFVVLPLLRAYLPPCESLTCPTCTHLAALQPGGDHGRLGDDVQPEPEAILPPTGHGPVGGCALRPVHGPPQVEDVSAGAGELAPSAAGTCGTAEVLGEGVAVTGR